MRATAAKFCLVGGGLTLAVAMLALAQGKPEYAQGSQQDSPRVAQVVALDECDPTTFNAALGPDFCKNIALGYSTTLSDLFADVYKRQHEGHPACHFCGECTTGCDVGAFFSTAYFLLPKAEATKKLDLRTNALAKNVLVDANGRAAGVAYVDRKTKQEVEVYGRAVVVAAGCIESSRIMLNSKSRFWPNGVANSSGQLGHNLCDHLYGCLLYTSRCV